MKNKIYIVVTGILLIISFSLLLLYYTQNFKENINIYKEIKYENITFEKKEVDTLTFASAEIGKITLENKGYFKQKYYYPKLVGCIKFKEGIDNSVEFEVRVLDLDYAPQSYREYYYYNQNGEFMNVGIGVTLEKTLVGIYQTNYNQELSLSLFNKNNLEKIDIYQIPRKEVNPLSENYYSNYNQYRCESIANDLKPIASVIIN